jgi:DNA-binding NarL/FixJ family response regulator
LAEFISTGSGNHPELAEVPYITRSLKMWVGGSNMIGVFIADDHAIVRQGLKHILSETRDISVAGEAEDAYDVLRKLRALSCDVLVLDLSMPGLSGFDVLKVVRQEWPALPVLVLSMYPEEQYAMRLLRAGAAGYLSKACIPDQLVIAIRKVASGGKYLSPGVAATVIDEFCEPDDHQQIEALSNREFQVMQMIAQGQTVSDIAAALSLSVKTVSTYRARVLLKMGMQSNMEIIHYALNNRMFA